MFRLTTLVMLVAIVAWPSGATSQSRPAGLVNDLLTDISDVEKKITTLAAALPDAAWQWRPGPGVRSSGDVVAHVTADNYVFPAALGIAVPPATGLDLRRGETIEAFEKRTRTRQQAMAELATSFAFLKQHVGATSEAQLSDAVTVFGQPSSRRATWVGATTHLHEHLGQLIAYARSNRVVPPWSR